MNGTRKPDLWRVIQEAGIKVDKNYRDYKIPELEAIVQSHELEIAPLASALSESSEPELLQPQSLPANPPTPKLPPKRKPVQNPRQSPVPIEGRDPKEMPGQRLNTKAHDEPLRIDPETGFLWYQEEVLKPAIAKPRGRRVIKYNDPGSQRVRTTGPQGTSEEFEIPGNRHRVSEAKITLPSYQVGIYRDPAMPMFRIHTYQEKKGFDREDVINFYGGRLALVPKEIARIYISNDLCYDISSTITAIETEARRIQLENLRGVPSV